MIVWLDHVLFALLAVLFPLWALTFGYRSLIRAAPERLHDVRLMLYQRAIVIQWSLVAMALVLWIARDRAWLSLGLVPRVTGGLIGVLVGLAIVAAVLWRKRGEALRDDASLESVRHQLRSIARIIPTDPGELRWFYRLSVTAGICEEILYRGYMFWYLGNWLEPIPTLLVASVLFGLGHSYQGPRGVLVTAAVGAFLGLAYGITGSLFAPMLIHALMDIHSGHLGYVAFRRERELRETMLAAAETIGVAEPEPEPEPRPRSDPAPAANDPIV